MAGRSALVASDNDPDLAAASTIEIAPLLDEYACPICFSSVQSCSMTSCGHLYCKKCIEECLNRKRQCPVCNAKCTIDSLIRNHHADRVVKLLLEAKEVATAKYFGDMIGEAARGNSGKNGSSAMSTTAEAPRPVAPIERVLHAAMKRALSAFQQQFDFLAQRHNQARELVKAKNVSEMSKAMKEHSKEVDRKKALTAIKARCESELKALDDAFDVSVAHLTALAEEHALSDSVCAPNFSDLNVNVVVASFASDDEQRKHCKKHKIDASSCSSLCVLCVKKQFDAVKFDRGATDSTVRAIVETLSAEAGDSITEWPSDELKYVSYWLLDPLNGGNTSKPSKSGKLAVSLDRDDENVPLQVCALTRITANTPLTQLRPSSNSSIIVLMGDVEARDTQKHSSILFESDQPRQCFTYSYEKGDDVTIDYFSCKTCALTWVCDTCAEVCHAGHEVEAFVAAHKPKWACCNCVKKKKCALPNKNTKAAEK